uniref:GP-PDE domain-containing protein n=1 Tax=Electrophorus electricus TaxID=8005 RepID=A0AAY5EKH0_ELEEL
MSSPSSLIIDMSAVVYVLSTVTGYVLTSALLLRCPSLLHRRRRETFRSRHISHRGGAGENLENTMAAFRHAVELGTDMLELDCHLTKDEQVVVLHDSNLRRLTGVDADISDNGLLVKVFMCAECFVEGGGSRRIPLLRDVFEAFPSLPINIDIKVNDDRLIRKNPRIPVLFSLSRVLLLLGMFYTGLLPFVPLKEQFLEIPMPSITTNLLMRKALFDHLTARGIQVYVWVLNDEDDFKRAFDLGATGVMTDYPTKLKECNQENITHFRINK